MLVGPRHGICHLNRIDHQRRPLNNAVSKRVDDTTVSAQRVSEVVGRHNQTTAAAVCARGVCLHRRDVTAVCVETHRT